MRNFVTLMLTDEYIFDLNPQSDNCTAILNDDMVYYCSEFDGILLMNDDNCDIEYEATLTRKIYNDNELIGLRFEGDIILTMWKRSYNGTRVSTFNTHNYDDLYA